MFDDAPSASIRSATPYRKLNIRRPASSSPGCSLPIDGNSEPASGAVRSVAVVAREDAAPVTTHVQLKPSLAAGAFARDDPENRSASGAGRAVRRHWPDGPRHGRVRDDALWIWQRRAVRAGHATEPAVRGVAACVDGLGAAAPVRATAAVDCGQRSGAVVAAVWLQWLLAGTVFIMLSADETAAFHEMSDTASPCVSGTALSSGWFRLLFGTCALVVIGALLMSCRAFLAALPASLRNRCLVATMVFLGGAVGIRDTGRLLVDGGSWRGRRLLRAQRGVREKDGTARGRPAPVGAAAFSWPTRAWWRSQSSRGLSSLPWHSSRVSLARVGSPRGGSSGRRRSGHRRPCRRDRGRVARRRRAPEGRRVASGFSLRSGRPVARRRRPNVYLLTSSFKLLRPTVW